MNTVRVQQASNINMMLSTRDPRMTLKSRLSHSCAVNRGTIVKLGAQGSP